MSRDSRRRRYTRIAAGTCTRDGEPPTTRTSIHNLPDDLLELILLRVRTPVCLFSSGNTCKLWRRVIASDGFLQRLRPRHRPNHLLGHYSVNLTWEQGTSSTVVEFVPCLECWLALAVDLRQRLSLDFLIDGEYKNNRPELTDSRGGLLAFVLHDSWHVVVVCDPWTREYRELNFSWLRRDMCSYDCLGAFILDAGNGDSDSDDENSLMSSFSVLFVCLIRDSMDNTRAAKSCVFSARDNKAWIPWTVSINNFSTDVSNVDMDQLFVGRTGGSIFFSGIKTILVVDEGTGYFSTITLPLAPDGLVDDRENLRVVSGGAARTLVRIVCLVHDDLKVFKATRDQHGGWECTVEKSVDLCQAANIESRLVIINRPWRFLDTTMAAAKNRVLIAYSPCLTLLSLDLQTMKLQRANKTTTRMTLNANRDYRRVFPYQLLWPQKNN